MSGPSCNRGALIVLEGCDRAGKSTQCSKLVQVLNERNIKAEYLAFPDRSTPVGQLIDDYLTKKTDLTDNAIHLLFSANRWELEPKMKAHINEGVTLIVDRYVYSGIAFSGAKEGMSIDWCKQAETGLPKPDAVFFLSLSPDALSQRGGFGNERYELTEMQTKVRDNFKELEDDVWQVISADQEVDALHQDILSRALSVIQDSKTKPLVYLW